MTHAYVVGQITVKDPLKWETYRGQVPGTLKPWGAELVFRGQQRAALAGVNPHADIVVIRFPNVAAADGWFMSDALPGAHSAQGAGGRRAAHLV